MKQTLVFETTIARPVSVVYDHLADPRNFLGLQPLLVDISDIRARAVPGMTVLQYKNIEAFRFGPFTYHNRIHVELALTQPPTRMDARVKSPGGVQLAVKYHFDETGPGTQLREVFHVKMPRLVKKFSKSQIAVIGE